MPEPMTRFLTRLHDPRAAARADGDLLRSYMAGRDEDAFRALVTRHGPMVYGICRRVLGPGGDPEDAFQATFLALARLAGSIRELEALAAWLYRTAVRVARRAKATARRERGVPVPPTAGIAAAGPLESLTARELLDALDAELARLPERLQLPLVLCYWHGLTREEAARRLGWPAGTLHGRLERGRAKLAARLRDRGFAPTILLASAVCVPPVSAGLVARTTELARTPIGNHVPAAVAALARAATPAVPRALAAWTVGLLALPLLVASVWSQPVPPGPPRGADSGPAPGPTVIDAAGDPLPPRAVARLGTHRFRADGWAERVVAVPGGKQFLTKGSRGVILWDAATGKEVRRFDPPAAQRRVDGASYGVAFESFAVSPDGKLLAAGTYDGSKLPCPIVLFDLITGAGRGELPGHQGGEWSANGPLAFLTPTLLASAGADHSVRLWDVEARRELHNLGGSHGHVSALAPTPDGRHLLVGGSEKEVGYWLVADARTGRVVRRVGNLPGGFVGLALAPGGKTVAVVIGVGKVQEEGGSNEVRLYAAPDWTEVRRWKAHAGAYPQRNAVAFAPDGKTLATGGADQTVRRWDAATGAEVGRPIRPYPYANDVAYLDGATLATFGSQHAVRLWDPGTGRPKAEFAGAESHLAAVAYSPDGRHVATAGGGGDATVRVWDAATGRQVARLDARLHDLTRVAFSPDGGWIATAESVGFARLWDRAGGREVRAFGGHKGWVQALAFGPGGTRLATGDESGTIRVWDAATGKLVRTLDGHTYIAAALVFTPDGSALFSGSWDHSIRQWDLRTGKAVRVIKGARRADGRPIDEGHVAPVTALALSADGRRLFSGSYDHTIRVWDVAAGRLCRTLKGTNPDAASSVKAIALSPDGRRLAAAVEEDGRSAVVHLWDVPSGEGLAGLTGHRGQVTGVAFSPDSRRLVSCSADTTAVVWDVTGVQAAATGAGGRALAAVREGLADPDPVTGYDAVCRAVAAGDAGVAVLRDAVKPAAAPEAAGVAELIRQLDDESFDRRERATRALAGLGVSAEPLLRAAAGRSPSAEAGGRIERVLDGFAGERRRIARAVEALEGINTPAARARLAELANGDAAAELTRDAKAALGRIDSRR